MESNWFNHFVNGLQSVVNVAGLAKGAISSSIAEGVKSGFYQITPSLIKLIITSGVFLIGLIMFALGLGIILENIFRFPGMGYLLVGVIFITISNLYFKTIVDG